MTNTTAFTLAVPVLFALQLHNLIDQQSRSYPMEWRDLVMMVKGINNGSIADGGLLDWTQQLLTNKKERMMTFGLGIQVLYHLTK